MSVQSASEPKAMLWAGYVMSGLASLFALMDGAMKLAKPDFVVEATTKLGYSEDSSSKFG